jgi:hypothetical protein
MNDEQETKHADARSLSNAGLGVSTCSECGGIVDVATATEWWTAWGNNAFDFNWQKNSGVLPLCEKCEYEGWVVCEECGARVDRDLYGCGYPEDFDGERICPCCAVKKGIAISVNILHL